MARHNTSQLMIMTSWATAGAMRRAALKVGHWLSQIEFVPPPRPAGAVASAPAGAVRPPPPPPLRAGCTLEVASTLPLVLIARGFLGPSECAAVIEAAKAVGRPMMAGAADPRDMKYVLF